MFKTVVNKIIDYTPNPVPKGFILTKRAPNNYYNELKLNGPLHVLAILKTMVQFFRGLPSRSRHMTCSVFVFSAPLSSHLTRISQIFQPIIKTVMCGGLVYNISSGCPSAYGFFFFYYVPFCI